MEPPAVASGGAFTVQHGLPRLAAAPPEQSATPAPAAVIVANLAPRKLRGVESQGMILAASRDGDIPVLVAPIDDVPPGTRLK